MRLRKKDGCVREAISRGRSPAHTGGLGAGDGACAAVAAAVSRGGVLCSPLPPGVFLFARGVRRAYADAHTAKTIFKRQTLDASSVHASARDERDDA